MDVLKSYFDTGYKISTKVHKKLSEKIWGSIKVYVHGGKLNIDVDKSGVFKFKYTDDHLLDHVKSNSDGDIDKYVEEICAAALSKYESVSRAFFFKP